MRGAAASLAASLWWGSLSVIGCLVVPLLFQMLSPKALAGQVAARLFSAQCWVSVGCALLLLGLSRRDGGLDEALPSEASESDPRPWLIGGVLLALLLEFGVAPRIAAREQLMLWHALGTGLYLVQWLCALRVLLSLRRSS